ncbi:MAG: tRNA (adenosine(37)-N6)-threonylcarbamoyltransferase complex ATPase subunit type 1 TsaE [Spirochaetes bacterium]|jgi:tRNA threonylcarbamoyladenosine biosynthesis protein TsaE|nr:tRNA (adenosine(37)-N6)-threonylcarbamoyltransferase complex ATPase subunit type 1 TsaE [Spirochaetota bacterium]
MIKEIITESAGETRSWAETIGYSAGNGTVIALSGELGSGKTVIAKGIARGMGIDEDITSPTFLFVEIYDNIIPLYHFDLYRINNESELDELNFEEYWEGSGVSVIEWAEKAAGRLPENIIKINISREGENKRRITIEYPDN